MANGILLIYIHINVITFILMTYFFKIHMHLDSLPIS